MHSKAVKVAPGKLPELLQPVRVGGQSGIVHCDRLPAQFLQLPAHQHGANGCLPNGSHAFPDHLLRVLFYLPFLEQIVQFLPAVLTEPYGEPFPAQGDGITGDKDELPAIFLEYAGGTVLAPAVKGMQAKKGHIIMSSQAFHQRLLLGGFHLIELGAK